MIEKLIVVYFCFLTDSSYHIMMFFTFFSNIVDFLTIAAFRLQFESQLWPKIFVVIIEQLRKLTRSKIDCTLLVIILIFSINVNECALGIGPISKSVFQNDHSQHKVLPCKTSKSTHRLIANISVHTSSYRWSCFLSCAGLLIVLAVIRVPNVAFKILAY